MHRTSADGTLHLALPSDREIILTRTFDASRGMVFDALTRPDLLPRWLEAPGRTMAICESDMKVGGAYRMVWRGPNKPDVGMRGVYREFVPGERLVRTEVWEDWEAGDSLVTVVLTEQGGRTTLTTTVLFPSRDVRDSVLKSGIERGAGESYDRLAELLASTRIQ